MIFSYLFIYLFIFFIIIALLVIYVIYNRDKIPQKLVNDKEISQKLVNDKEISQKFVNNKEIFSDNLKNNDKCICMFDLDKTLTCSIKQAKEAINTCRQNNCILAINTARFGPYLNDVPLNDLGLSLNEIKNDIYHGSGPNVLSTLRPDEFDNYIALKKVDHLYTIKNKYNVDPKKIILFDDNFNNIKLARENGFRVIYANNPMCGLNNNVSKQIDNILNP